jgi:hypothetical protein
MAFSIAATSFTFSVGTALKTASKL